MSRIGVVVCVLLAAMLLLTMLSYLRTRTELVGVQLERDVLQKERDEARAQWCQIMEWEFLGPNADGTWTGSITPPETREQWDQWCGGQAR